MTTLANSFHGTAARTTAKPGDILSPSQLARIRRALCGMADCQCSDSPAGTRHSRVTVAMDYAGGDVRYRLIDTSEVA